MSDETPSLHIDNDWKKQAQEEKRRLAELQEKQRAEAAKAKSAPAGPAGGPPTAGGRRAAGEPLVGTFSTLVNTFLTQALMYLGEFAPGGGEPSVNLDAAKFHVDHLTLLEEKTKNNLSEQEQYLLDSALYDVRARFISVASQYI